MKIHHLLALVLAVAGVLCATPARADHPVTKTTYTYALVGELPLKADVYSPQSSPYGTQRPVIVFVHGGGWTCGNRDGYGGLPHYLAQTFGVVTGSASYRLAPVTDAVIEGGRIVSPGARDGCTEGTFPTEGLGLPQHRAAFPAQMVDLKNLMWQLRRHADALQIDRKRIAVVGASAGGHLVGMLGTTRELAPDAPPTAAGALLHSQPDAIVSIAGPWDLRAGAPLSHPSVPGILRNLFGGEPTSAQRTAASPITAIAGTPVRFPPTLFLHGAADTLVEPRQSSAACAVMPSCAYGAALIVDTPAGVDPHDAMYLLQARFAEFVTFLAVVFGAPP
ncbi:alpha/beta hydrolase [Aquincola sp. S2]|uniref:Alpha/beta hydrolase n=1 Tax=Pseudaquabacterium terrae TaxID=2732868 RepID=A0ABX2EK34_9BURK|nr:alpha/beta hydrolase [Aquabacterium terrae]NRF68935.1 alpha/beta hydrolase [Aquabacterium terrae]